MIRETLTLSALIAAVLLVRAVFKNHVPKRMIYALWLVVLLKLCLPGTLFSLTAWMVLSWLYSYYADHFSHYSVLYGSIGAVIVALIWLNLTAVTLILGAEMNGVLISMRKDRLEQDVNIPKT